MVFLDSDAADKDDERGGDIIDGEASEEAAKNVGGSNSPLLSTAAPVSLLPVPSEMLSEPCGLLSLCRPIFATEPARLRAEVVAVVVVACRPALAAAPGGERCVAPACLYRVTEAKLSLLSSDLRWEAAGPLPAPVSVPVPVPVPPAAENEPLPRTLVLRLEADGRVRAVVARTDGVKAVGDADVGAEVGSLT
jgi:hypothetical protein